MLTSLLRNLNAQRYLRSTEALQVDIGLSRFTQSIQAHNNNNNNNNYYYYYYYYYCN